MENYNSIYNATKERESFSNEDTPLLTHAQSLSADGGHQTGKPEETAGWSRPRLQIKSHNFVEILASTTNARELGTAS